MEGTQEFDTAFRIVRPDGQIRHLRGGGTVYRDPSTGRALRMVGVNWDSTEQRTAELALRNSEALQRDILAHAGSSIVAPEAPRVPNDPR